MERKERKMTNKKFEEIRQVLDTECVTLLTTKGREYANGKDRLSNFKEIEGVDPLLVWYIFFKKHVNAIEFAVKNKKTLSESMHSRFMDARNYIDLGFALMVERFEEGEVILSENCIRKNKYPANSSNMQQHESPSGLRIEEDTLKDYGISPRGA